MRLCETGTISDLTLFINEAIDQLTAPVAHADGSIASAVAQINALLTWNNSDTPQATGTLANAVSTYNAFVVSIKRRMGGDGDPVRGYVVFEVKFDGVNLRLTELKCINNSTEACYGKMIKTSNSRTLDQVFPAMQTTTVPIPTNPGQRIEIILDARGRIDGVDYFFMWPA